MVHNDDFPEDLEEEMLIDENDSFLQACNYSITARNIKGIDDKYYNRKNTNNGRRHYKYILQILYAGKWLRL